jgi:hypothetical protein
MFELFASILIGVVLIGCFFWTRRAPVAGIGAALALWLGMQIVLAALSPATLLHAFLSASGVALLLGKLLALLLLVQGLRAALEARTRLLAAERAQSGSI